MTETELWKQKKVDHRSLIATASYVRTDTDNRFTTGFG